MTWITLTLFLAIAYLKFGLSSPITRCVVTGKVMRCPKGGGTTYTHLKGGIYHVNMIHLKGPRDRLEINRTLFPELKEIRGKGVNCTDIKGSGAPGVVLLVNATPCMKNWSSITTPTTSTITANTTTTSTTTNTTLILPSTHTTVPAMTITTPTSDDDDDDDDDSHDDEDAYHGLMTDVGSWQVILVSLAVSIVLIMIALGFAICFRRAILRRCHRMCDRHRQD
ncbi:uncharacterized protein LOC124260248 isoform X1 [Haliotis rubra]|uniref:uncharacterized protein LOC124260248 isoform X1 n=1 Tax=Haliotis rubra TaxID=36100 RepID=UPI001EE5FEE3|nr:uncharacterized protein LOC124260248 isoform X1 [Haliotis rubra]